MNQEIQKCEFIPIDLFKELKKLGAGAFGTVGLYEYRPADGPVEQRAIKLLQGVTDDEFNRELLPFLNLQHPNLVGFYGETRSAVFRGIVMEYMAGGSLDDVLHPKKQAPYSYTLKDVLNWSIQSAKALEYMHSKTFTRVDKNKQPVYSRYIHRDLKPANILLDGTYQTLKLGDFGFTKKIDSSRNTPGTGTPLYMAPEVWLNRTYDETADVYSWTLILWECLTGVVPFEDCEDSAQFDERKQEHSPLANVNADANSKASPQERKKANIASDKFNQLIQCGSKFDRNRLSMSSWRKLLEILHKNSDVKQREAQANTICVGNDREFFYCNQLEQFDWAGFDGNLADFEKALNPLIK